MPLVSLKKDDDIESSVEIIFGKARMIKVPEGLVSYLQNTLSVITLEDLLNLNPEDWKDGLAVCAEKHRKALVSLQSFVNNIPKEKAVDTADLSLCSVTLSSPES